jgi:phenylacetic acid degradation operon negative regulatory protein
VASLSARSIVASTLLGSLPPRLPGRLLVAFAEEFGVNAGTTRVALSRMVDRGELARDGDGQYELIGSLLQRQDRQEAGLAPADRPWLGDWEIYVVPGGARASNDRSALRRGAEHLGLAERREGVWMRPNNLDSARVPTARSVLESQAERFLAHPDSDGVELAQELFDLGGWAAEARRLQVQMGEMAAALGTGEPGSLAAGFEVAAHTLRHLVADPHLPESLWPHGWPTSTLRRSYANYDRQYRRHLSAFFRSRSRLAG